MGKILDMARRNANLILTSFGFESDITLKKEEVEITIQGLAPVHHLSFDTENNTVNSKNAHVTISEQSLKDLSFPYRNSGNEIYLIGILVSFADTSGNIKTYTVKENFADETIGVIVLNLGKYAQ
jgi:hypothetical protein